jgi:hypothetical protein
VKKDKKEAVKKDVLGIEWYIGIKFCLPFGKV